VPKAAPGRVNKGSLTCYRCQTVTEFCPMQDRNRQHLAALMEQRKDELGLSWEQIADRGGISRETMQQVRLGSSQMRYRTKRAVERGLAWPERFVDDVLDQRTRELSDQPVSRAAIESGDLSPAQVVKVLAALAELGDADLFWQNYRNVYHKVQDRLLDESQDQIN
jgi:transcriptional regulator with XRE-family HTH domain